MEDVKSLMQQSQLSGSQAPSAFFDGLSSQENIRADAPFHSSDNDVQSAAPTVIGNAGDVPFHVQMNGFYFLASGTVVYAYAGGNPHGNAIAGLLCSFGLLKMLSHV